MELLKPVTLVVVLLQPAVVGRPRGGESQPGSQVLLDTGRRSMGEIMKQQILVGVSRMGGVGNPFEGEFHPLSKSAWSIDNQGSKIR